ncbi:MAG: RHS repeat-associated core domain-containing protein, partial [Planctomycetota bacterium]
MPSSSSSSSSSSSPVPPSSSSSSSSSSSLPLPPPEPDPIPPPCEDACACECGCSAAPVRYVNGEVQLDVTDLSAGGFGGMWRQQRVYSNQLPHDHDYGNGFNWLVRQWPYLIEKTGGSIVFVQSTRDALWFNFDGVNYVAQHGAKHTLTHDTANQVFKLTTPAGEEWQFHDFDQTAQPPGLFKSHTTAGGQLTQVTSYTANNRVAEIQRSHTSGASTTTESFQSAYFATGEQSG